MRFYRPFLLMFLVFCLAPSILLAKADCPAIVEAAFASVDEFCQQAGRNQACYGNIALEAEPQPDAENFHFDQIGDIVNVADIRSLRLSPMDEEHGEWGVALMRLQANLPDTVPGQNVTFLMFGDVEIENAVREDDGYNPMQAFYLRTGVSDSGCEEAPESGLLVQTPEGVGEVAFNVNGIDVQMGSTVFFQGTDDGEMTVSTLEGAAFLEQGNKRHVIIAGTLARLSLIEPQAEIAPGPLPGDTAAGGSSSSNSGGTETQSPILGESYDVRRLGRLPLRLLSRRIEIRPPLTEAERRNILQRLESGEPLCGEDGLPFCDDFFEGDGRFERPCIFQRRDGCLTPEATEEASGN